MVEKTGGPQIMDCGFTESNPNSQIRNPKCLTFAHSPDPDDAFMFYGFASGAVSLPGYTIQHHLQDIESLNARALQGDFEITAVSAHAYAHLADKYWVLSCGASVGRKYGPILVAKRNLGSRISDLGFKDRSAAPKNPKSVRHTTGGRPPSSVEGEIRNPKLRIAI